MNDLYKVYNVTCIQGYDGFILVAAKSAIAVLPYINEYARKIDELDNFRYTLCEEDVYDGVYSEKSGVLIWNIHKREPEETKYKVYRGTVVKPYSGEVLIAAYNAIDAEYIIRDFQKADISGFRCAKGIECSVCENDIIKDMYSDKHGIILNTVTYFDN